MKLIDKVSVLHVITTLDVPCERLLNAALESTLQRVIIVGTDADGGGLKSPSENYWSYRND
jgi:hypothetical protein